MKTIKITIGAILVLAVAALFTFLYLNKDKYKKQEPEVTGVLYSDILVYLKVRVVSCSDSEIVCKSNENRKIDEDGAVYNIGTDDDVIIQIDKLPEEGLTYKADDELKVSFFPNQLKNEDGKYIISVSRLDKDDIKVLKEKVTEDSSKTQ